VIVAKCENDMAGVPRNSSIYGPAKKNLCIGTTKSRKSFAQVLDNTIQYAIVSVNE